MGQGNCTGIIYVYIYGLERDLLPSSTGIVVCSVFKIKSWQLKYCKIKLYNLAFLCYLQRISFLHRDAVSRNVYSEYTYEEPQGVIDVWHMLSFDFYGDRKTCKFFMSMAQFVHETKSVESKEV
jgi:hypothetical protein